MDEAIIIGPGEYMTRSGRRATIVEPLRSGAARGGLGDDRVYVWNAAGKCLSGNSEDDIVGLYPKEESA
jgi:hypothetical protein